MHKWHILKSMKTTNLKHQSAEELYWILGSLEALTDERFKDLLTDEKIRELLKKLTNRLKAYLERGK